MQLNDSQVPSSDVSDTFMQGMLNRIAFGAIRYGSVADNRNKIDFLASMRQRVKQYRQTNNTEFLIDAANFLMFEFLYPSEPGAEFKGTDSDQSPGLISVEGLEVKHPDQVEVY